MGEEFYSSIKLVSGEEIFSLVSVDENDGDPILVLQNPVIMKIINGNNGQFIKIRPWMEIPDDDIYVIKLDKIITMTEVTNSMLIEYYNYYTSDNYESSNTNLNSKSDGKVKLSNSMGYISSVEDARKKLEDIFKKTKET